ncbi:MAG TPA: hypothetical protein DCM40_18655, partial [Maribacter sp.]|nr:hypothetical protein [Maribacter sp.]
RNDIARTFFLTGYTKPQEVTSAVTRNIKTSTPYLGQVFTGSGITGQTTGLIDTFSYPEGASRTNINLYRVDDLLGPLSGEQVLFHESSTQVSENVSSFTDAVESFSSGSLYSGSKSVVSFNSNLTSSDTIEVYSYITGTSNHNNIASRQSNKYEFDSLHTGQKVNVYKNGLLQAEKSANLLPTGITIDYAQYGASGTGVANLGPEDGVVSGQRYYVDFSSDYISGGVGSGFGVDGGNLGVGETMAITTDEIGDAGNLGASFEAAIKSTGFITATRDGLVILHSGADSNSIVEADKIKDNISFLDIRLDYSGDYDVLEEGNSINTKFYPGSPGAEVFSTPFDVSDTVIYDRMTSGTAKSKFFIYTGQQRTDGLYGKNSSDKLILKTYYLGETNTSDDEVYYEPYLNGKKLKSGEHYRLLPATPAVEQIEFDVSTFGGATGLIHIAPLTSGTKNFDQASSNGTDSFIEPNFKIVDEQVWVEGVRQAKDSQYEIVDSSSKKKKGKRIDNDGITFEAYSSISSDGTIGIGS